MKAFLFKDLPYYHLISWLFTAFISKWAKDVPKWQIHTKCEYVLTKIHKNTTILYSQGLCKTYLGTSFANVIFWLFFENCRMHYTRTRCTLHCLCMTDACEYERQWEKYVELSHNSSYESSDSVSRSITHF